MLVFFKNCCKISGLKKERREVRAILPETSVALKPYMRDSFAIKHDFSSSIRRTVAV